MTTLSHIYHHHLYIPTVDLLEHRVITNFPVQSRSLMMEKRRTRRRQSFLLVRQLVYRERQQWYEYH